MRVVHGEIKVWPRIGRLCAVPSGGQPRIRVRFAWPPAPALADGLLVAELVTSRRCPGLERCTSPVVALGSTR